MPRKSFVVSLLKPLRRLAICLGIATLATLAASPALAATTGSYIYRVPVQGLVASAVAQTPSDPYFQYVSLLMHMDTTTDTTGKNILTSVGSPLVSTTTEKMGTGSVYFNGSSTLQGANSAGLQFGTNDFTVEFWLYLPGSWSSEGSAGIVGQRASDSTSGWVIYHDTTKPSLINLRLGTGASGQAFCTTSSTPSTNTWQHWAVARQGTTVRWFLNGTLDATCATSSVVNVNDSTGNLFVGYAQTWGGYLTGYVDDLRITNGVARYTSSFTAPTSPYPDH